MREEDRSGNDYRGATHNYHCYHQHCGDTLRETVTLFRVHYRSWWPRGCTPSAAQAFKLHAPRKQLARPVVCETLYLPYPQLQSALTFTAPGAPDVCKQRIVIVYARLLQ